MDSVWMYRTKNVCRGKRQTKVGSNTRTKNGQSNEFERSVVDFSVFCLFVYLFVRIMWASCTEGPHKKFDAFSTFFLTRLSIFRRSVHFSIIWLADMNLHKVVKLQKLSVRWSWSTDWRLISLNCTLPQWKQCVRNFAAALVSETRWKPKWSKWFLCSQSYKLFF